MYSIYSLLWFHSNLHAKLSPEAVEVPEFSVEYLRGVYDSLDEEDQTFVQMLTHLHHNGFIANVSFYM